MWQSVWSNGSGKTSITRYIVNTCENMNQTHRQAVQNSHMFRSGVPPSDSERESESFDLIRVSLTGEIRK